MAQSKNGPGKRAAGKASPNGPGQPERQAAYFLSLSLENVRCFGPKQRLDLSDGNGKPAPWTIILGLNGTGKTTLLQLLAGFQQVPFGEPFRHGSLHFRIVNDLLLEIVSVDRERSEGPCS